MVATTATTAATATTATTATAATAVAIETAAALGAVAVILLIVLLVSKELAGASDHPRAQRLSRVINVGAMPLMFAFVAIAASKVMAVLS
jgi:uncharacterized membrane protein